MIISYEYLPIKLLKDAADHCDACDMSDELLNELSMVMKRDENGTLVPRLESMCNLHPTYLKNI